MWAVKARVIPVIIGAPRAISRSFIKYLSNIPEKHEIKELETTAVLGTTYPLEDTNLKVQNVKHRK